MKRLLIFVQSIMLLALCQYAFSYDGHELGHHWEDPAYIGEVRLQVVVMAAIVCIIAVTWFISLMLKNRSAER